MLESEKNMQTHTMHLMSLDIPSSYMVNKCYYPSETKYRTRYADAQAQFVRTCCVTTLVGGISLCNI